MLDAPSGADRAPLAERLRPRTIDELIGQAQLFGPGERGRALLAAPPWDEAATQRLAGTRATPRAAWCAWRARTCNAACGVSGCNPSGRPVATHLAA